MEEFEEWFNENESRIYKYQLTDKQIAYFAWKSARDYSTQVDEIKDDLKTELDLK